jgi:hypothetical protein
MVSLPIPLDELAFPKASRNAFDEGDGPDSLSFSLPPDLQFVAPIEKDAPRISSSSTLTNSLLVFNYTRIALAS